MRIMVTGASCFIGRIFVDYLAKNTDYDIIAVLRKGKEFNFGGTSIKILRLDMDDYDKIDELLSENIDILVSFAWEGTRGTDRNCESIQLINYQNVRKLFDSVIKLGCKKIIQIGSQAEYGNKDTEIYEEDACNPQTEYGFFKHKVYEYGMKISNENNIMFYEPRLFSVYGHGDKSGSLISLVLNGIKNNEPIELSLCSNYWNYTHVNDVVDVLWLFLTQNVANGAYNVASKDIRVLSSFVEEIVETIGIPCSLYYNDFVKNGPNLIPNSNKLRIAFNWDEKKKFNEEILKIFQNQDVNSDGI